MYWLQLVVVVALLAAVGWLAIGGGGHMSEPVPDRPDLALPNEGLLARADVDRVRFSVGARGYRMDEVDDVLDRLAQEIEMREQRIAELEGRAPKHAASPDAPGWAEFEAESAAEPEADAEARFEPEADAEPGEPSGHGAARESGAEESGADAAAQSRASAEGAQNAQNAD